MKRRVALALALLASLAGCGQQNSYKAAEGALRDWLTAANEGDETACDLMTANYRQELVQSAEHGPVATCGLRISQMTSGAARLWLPPADSDIQIPAWDPSGEAFAEVTDPRSDRVAEFWMQYENNLWLVAGRER